MKKLRLDVDQVRVDSFVTDHVRSRAGTVRGYGYTLFGCPPRHTDPMDCIEEPNPDTGLSQCEECITLDFPGMGYLTCTPD